MVEHAMLVTVGDAVSMSWKRADGLAELCLGRIEAGSDEANAWHVVKEALYMIKDDLVKADKTLDELHRISWDRADKSDEKHRQAMEWVKIQEEGE